MFQRIQTIYLFLAVVLTVVLFCLPAIGGAMREATDACVAGGIFTIAGLLPLLCFALAAIGGGLLPLVTMFLYHRRPRQIGWCRVAMWLLAVTVVVAIVSFALHCANDYLLIIAPVFDLLFVWLATRAIRRDERLVRDADRIR